MFFFHAIYLKTFMLFNPIHPGLFWTQCAWGYIVPHSPLQPLIQSTCNLVRLYLGTWGTILPRLNFADVSTFWWRYHNIFKSKCPGNEVSVENAPKRHKFPYIVQRHVYIWIQDIVSVTMIYNNMIFEQDKKFTTLTLLTHANFTTYLTQGERISPPPPYLTYNSKMLWPWYLIRSYYILCTFISHHWFADFCWCQHFFWLTSSIFSKISNFFFFTPITFLSIKMSF